MAEQRALYFLENMSNMTQYKPPCCLVFLKSLGRVCVTKLFTAFRGLDLKNSMVEQDKKNGKMKGNSFPPCIWIPFSF